MGSPCERESHKLANCSLQYGWFTESLPDPEGGQGPAGRVGVTKAFARMSANDAVDGSSTDT